MQRFTVAGLAWLMLLQAMLSTPALAAARQLQWIDLLPEAERQGFVAGPPLPVHDYLDYGRMPGGGDEFDVECLGVAARLSGKCSPAQRQSLSARVNEALDGRQVRLSGYVVPLELAPDGAIREFFLAPYVGACIHVPPPAPNQLVHVKLPSARKLPVPSAAHPIAVQGVLHAKRASSALGAASYSLEVQDITPVTDDR